MTSYKDVLAGGASLAPSPNNVLVTPPFTGGVQRTLGSKVFETITFRDFGAVGDGADNGVGGSTGTDDTDDANALQTAESDTDMIATTELLVELISVPGGWLRLR